ncbi:MAG: hypothetical protein KKH44_05635, partial [Bacteroidetes bacterium]|nr:hypothetical protein [Bacteroidota bacterium]
MKILYVVRNLDRYSGAATQALNLAREINNNKVLVDIVNVSDSEKLRTLAADIDGVSINHLSRKPAGLLSFFKIVFKYDVVHFHGMFIVHMLIAKLVGKKVVLKTTLSGEDDFSAIHKRIFGRLRIAILNRIVDINNSLTSDLAIVNSGYMPKSSIVTIPNFVSVNESDVKKINLFIFVGAIVKRKHPLKAINYFLDNYAHLEESMLYLVGPSNIQENVEDAVYLSEIIEKSRQHPDKVVLTGNLAHEEVLKL